MQISQYIPLYNNYMLMKFLKKQIPIANFTAIRRARENMEG
jgi:hypothetical protein